MIWIVFAFLTAFFESIKDVLSKKSLKEIDEYVVAWSLWFFPIPLLLIILFITGIPSVDPSFWLILISGGICNVFATIFYMKSIKLTDLSLSVPLLAFSPLFLLITSPVLVGEFPDQYGLIGVLLIVLGSYMLNIKKRSKGIIEPFHALIKEKGPQFMLLVALIWSISANIDKIGVKHSTPFFWITMMAIFVSFSMFPIVVFRFPKNRKKTKNWMTTLVPIGLIYGLTILNQMIAINLTLVSYVISIKRMSTILVVIWGYLIFKEKNIKNRITGTVIMIIGVLFITLM